MKLVASMIVHNELDRYLPIALDALLEFVDEVRIVDDASTDSTPAFLASCGDRVKATRNADRMFFVHEGRARQHLLEWTMDADPTHIVVIDADEFVDDGAALRGEIERSRATPVWTACMEEVWRAGADDYDVRQDGGWDAHEVTIAFRPIRDRHFYIADRALACGREPVSVRRISRHAAYSGVSILHFGWTNVAERIARHERYAVADGGRFHRSAHLDSILWPDDEIEIETCPAPAGLSVYGDAVLRAGR